MDYPTQHSPQQPPTNGQDVLGAPGQLQRPARRRSPFVRFLSGLVYAVFCVLTLGLGSVAGWANKSPIMMAMIGNMLPFTHAEPTEVFKSDTLTFLVLGCDEDRYYAPPGQTAKQVLNKQARSDMMLLVRLDFTNNRVGGISIPRDLWVEVDGHDGHKINAYHAIGGPELSAKAVEQVTGIKPDRVIVLNYKAFQDMVDLVGGVEVYVPRPMKYTDVRGGLFIDFDKGRHRMDGYDAMCYVRFRKSDSDFARMDRQRDFMVQFKNAILSKPQMLPRVLEEASNFVGDTMNPTELASLADFMRGVPSESIKMGPLPVVDGRGSTLRLDEDKLEDALKAYQVVQSTSQPKETSRKGSEL